MDHFCHNHPGVKTTKRCYTCKKYICAECFIPFLDRSFCSWSCLLASLCSSFAALFRANRSGEKKSIIRRHGVFRASTFWGFCLFLFISAILGVSLYKIFLESQAAQTYRIAMETIESPHPDALSGSVLNGPDGMVLSNRVSINGEAADSVIISLKVNGKLIDATLPQDGQFVFNDIRLSFGANEILVLGMDTKGNVKILQKIETTYGSPRLSFLARDVTRGNVERKEIALTFDGGAGNGATKAILDILRDKKVTCTMFLTGGFLKRYPNEVQRIVADGHEVGNHTWSHPHLTSFGEDHVHTTLPEISRNMLQKELLETAKQFKVMTGKKIKPYWRAPFGEHNLEIRMWAAEIGFRQIGWTNSRGESMDSMDWVADTTSASFKTTDEILQNLLNFGKSKETGANGSIILMHLDTQRQKDPAHRILPAFVDSMRARGYTFTTISQLLRP